MRKTPGSASRRRTPALERLLSMVVVALTLAALLAAPPVGAVDAPGLVFSTASNRSLPVALDRATVAGKIYVFVAPEAGISRVRFYLDDPSMSRTPRRTEDTAPFDLAGGTASTASPFDTTTITDGPHTVTASITSTSGAVSTLHAEVVVANQRPSIVFDQTSLGVATSEGGTASRTVGLRASDGTSPAVAVTVDAPWLRSSLATTEQASSVAVSVDTAGLPPGIYRGTVTASADGYRSATLPVHVSSGDQVHLSWVGDPATTLTVVWHTSATESPSTVQYRVEGTLTWSTASGARRVSGTAGTLHEVALSGLSPATAYEYRYQRDDGSWSTVHRTRTAPAAGSASDFEVAYVADTGLVGREDGLTTGTAQVIRDIAAADPLLTLLGGDYAYYNTDTRFGSLDNSIDAWFNQMQPIGQRSPMMVSYGNHETLLGEGYQPWADRFPTPAGYDNRRNFSFDVGNVHFVSIYAVYDTNGLSAGQLSWIEKDMAAARARGQVWIVPFFHVSPFADGRNHPSNLKLRAQLGPLFERQGVKVALSSHDQAYERTYPLTDVPATNRPTSLGKDCYSMQDGVTWVKVSPGGKLSNKNGSFSQFATNPAPAWTAIRDNTSSTFARVAFSSAGTLTVEAYGVRGDGGHPFLKDRFRYEQHGCAGQGDSVAPETSINSGPSGAVNSTSASFGFAASDAGSTFECRLDGQAFSACSSPVAYSSLTEGAHVLEVRATDAAGNVDVTPAQRSWIVDVTPPEVSLTTPAAGATSVDRAAAVSVTASETVASASIRPADFSLHRAGSTSPVQATVAYDAASRSVRLTPTVALEPSTVYTAGLAAGAFTDVAGNPLASDHRWSFTTGQATAVSGPAVTRLVLVNADTDQDVRVLTDGDTISFSAVGTSRLSVRADTVNATGSVVFGYDAASKYRVENTAPYTIAGDTAGDYAPWTPKAGTHVLKATAYTSSNGGGTAGGAVQVSVTVSQ